MIGIGTAGAVAVPAGVDQGRVTLGQGLGIEPESFECLGTEIGQKDVGRLEQPVQHGLSGLRLDVQGHGSLPPIGQGQGKVDAARLAADPLGGETTVRVTLERSMWTTSAPQSARSAPATGTKTHCANSTTRTPSNAPLRPHLPAAPLLPFGLRTTTGMIRSVRV